MPHARLLAASSLLTAGLLALGPEAVVALADPDSGGSTGGASGSSTTGSTGASGGSTTTGTGTPNTGGSTSTGSSTTGSTPTGPTSTTGSPTGGASSWSAPNLLGGMVGQFTRIIQHPTDVLNNLPVVGGVAPGTKPSAPKNAPAIGPGTSSTTGSSTPAQVSVSAQPPAGQSPSSQSTTTNSNVAATPQAPLAQLPLAAAQIPLTALDLVKTTIPTVVDAVPIPGLAALPAFADALINPIESTVRGLASAASALPFLQYTPGMPITQVPLDNRGIPRVAPLVPKTFAAATDSVPRDVSPGAPGNPVKPIPPIQPRDTFAAENHVVAATDFRPGYPDYLRAAGLREVAAVAVPGFAGIITLTAAGGLVGYRQARATSSAPARAARFVH
ncbi:hypothetical protein C1S80_01500 [Mycolicibacterium aubagnense]|nr:hypothetical protein C1S80_01500 [Mycolicibacterium aubagnense]